MDPPPPASATTAAANFVATTMQLHNNYQDSIESSPRSHNADWDDPLPPVPGAKLRLMCSYGGHIIPRPHDKSLCYVGGDTRIVVVDRHSSLADLCMRLSRTLLNGRPFTLKYQLPLEDLDSLISIATDEDLENMIEEYDRITMASPSKPLRIRLFLFFTKPETAASMGSLLDDAKHETWFVDALNNSAGMIPRGLSDSATMECMVNLDAVHASDSCNDLENQGHDSIGHIDKQVVKNSNSAQDVQSIPDSPAVENDSSFGSSSSVPSMSNLPPIRVRVEEADQGRVQDPKMGLEEQFGQMNFGVPPIPTSLAGVATIPLGVISNHENANRVFLDDERSDQGGTVVFRKPPLPLQTLQNRGVANPIVSGGYGLPSPDSVASDSSIASANSQSKPVYFQDQTMRDNTIPGIPIAESDGFLTSQQVPIQHLHDPAYLLTSQLDQKQPQQPQQFVHTTTHYIHHHHPAAAAAGHVPVQQYYHPIYTTPSQQQLHHPIDQQYPVYLMPITQTQPTYNMSVQSSPAETPLAVPNRQSSASPAMVSSPLIYNDSNQPSLYPQKVTAAMPEMAASVYRTAVTSTPPPMLQVPHNQYQQPYMGLPQMNYPSQSIGVAPAPSGTANYGFDYTNAPPHNIPATPMASQYQTMTQAAAAALSDASRQLPADGSQQQQIKNS